VLNEKVGDRLPERSWLQRRKWYSRKLPDDNRPRQAWAADTRFGRRI